MTTPIKRHNKVRQQIIDGLISTTASAWEQKVIEKDESGKEIVGKKRVDRSALRYPLAQNVADHNVERLAKKWL